MPTPTKDDAPPPKSFAASDGANPGAGSANGSASAGTTAGFRYVYMFEKDKSPTTQLDAILRAIARHIVLEIGDRTDSHLTPPKLAAFYKSVGGDYDAFFVERDFASISWIWQVIGCQHSLQPTDNDFEAPCIPALTARGFSRWESLEILLGPEEHVPFLQHAVRNWNLKQPDTGEPFPPDLPTDVFPSEPDDEVDRWHKTCANNLWKSATGDGEAADHDEDDLNAKSGSPTDHQGPRFAYVHVNPSSQPAGFRRQPRPAQGARPRPFSYVHPASRQGGHTGQRGPMPARSPEDDHREPQRGRRRSFSDYPRPASASPPTKSYPGMRPNAPHLKSPPQGRRHSHPRHYSSESSDGEPQAPYFRARSTQSPPSSSSGRRFGPPPSAPQPPPAVGNGSMRPQRPDLRPGGELKRRSNNSPLGSLREKVTEKVSGLFASGRPPDRPVERPSSGRSAYADSPRVRRSPIRAPSSRMAHAYADVDSEETSDPESSDDDLQRRRQGPPRPLYRERGRAYELDSRDLDSQGDSGPRRINRPPVRRPEPQRRTSSHADIDRRREQALFDPRGRDRMRNERRRFERRSPDGRGSLSPMAAPGRRYQDAAVYS